MPQHALAIRIVVAQPRPRRRPRRDILPADREPRVALNHLKILRVRLVAVRARREAQVRDERLARLQHAAQRHLGEALRQRVARVVAVDLDGPAELVARLREQPVQVAAALEAVPAQRDGAVGAVAHEVRDQQEVPVAQLDGHVRREREVVDVDFGAAFEGR